MTPPTGRTRIAEPNPAALGSSLRMRIGSSITSESPPGPPPSRVARPARPSWGLAFCALLASGCDSEVESLRRTGEPGTCAPDFACPVGQTYRRGVCQAERCARDQDCCPGQRCTVAVGFCGNRYLACTDNADCAARPGQACISFRGGRFCGYPNRDGVLSAAKTQSCATAGDCDPDRACMGGRCVVFAPCRGGCPDGQVCDLDSDTCFEEPTCDATCGPGQIRVVADPDLMSGPGCCRVECTCATLPPLQTGQFGWYADIAASDQTVVMSAFDPGFGDLVVTYFDDQGRATQTDYVDGFPDSGPILANPDGPRGGRRDPGPTVGEHTSIAIDAQEVVHVAYHDRDAGTLKYAFSSGGEWTISTVDDTGRTGLYTSLAIGRDGNPRIAFMMAEGRLGPEPGRVTALRFARARTNMPADPADWETVTVDVRAKPPTPCDGGCAEGALCVERGAGPACVPKSTGCIPACEAGLRCTGGAGVTPACRRPFSPLEIDALLPGVGLFADLAITSAGLPVIAYYDQVAGDLKLAEGAPDDRFSVQVVEGSSALSPTDVGRFASVAVGPGDRIGIAFFDATNDDLVYIEYPMLQREIVDHGVTPPTLRRVGADADLVFDAAGRPAIAYQDPTQIDLLYARRVGDPPMWTQEVLRGAPAAGASMGTASGFYACQDRRGNQAFVGSVDVTFDARAALRLDLVVDVTSLE